MPRRVSTTAPRLAALALAATLALSLAACQAITEPGVQLDCSTLAATYDTASGLVSAGNGLRYRDAVVGGGATVATGTRVVTHYAACLPNGEVYSTLVGSSNLAFTVGQGQVVAGVDQGVVGMRVGGQRELVIPPELAYGSSGGGFLAPNSTIVVTVEVIGVE